jgi:YfiH family protein
VWTDRSGGVSAPPYATANLAFHVGDAPGAVAENRRRVAAALGLGAPDAWCWLAQVHGAVVAPAAWGAAPTADAAVTAVPSLPVAVLTADCAPLALASDTAAAVVHAGWRGIAAGVVEAAVAALRDTGRGRVRAALGPCIRPGHYEFGMEELGALAVGLGAAVVATTETGRPAFDLPAAVRGALARAGVDDLVDLGPCTAAEPGWFSHRRDGVTGRQALVGVLEAARG